MTVWTSGRLKSFITSCLRGGFRRYPPKYEVLKSAFIGKKINSKTNRLSSHYLCNECKGEFPTSEVQVDHVEPIVNPELGFTTWDDFIARLFCESSNLQCLCKTCHAVKTKAENNKRKLNDKHQKTNTK